MSSSALSIQNRFLFMLLVTSSLCIIQIKSSGDVEEELEVGGLGRDLGTEQREFDYFKLALQWPGTNCRGKHRCCPSNGCCRHSGSLNYFTIHGLWPDYNDGTWPACCNGPRFDAKEISPLHDALDKYWPSLSCGSPSTCHGGRGTFWGHEWEKHGTCSSPVVQDEYGYFLTALNVYFKYNVTQVLIEAGYVPSNSEKYPLGGVISAIQNAFHATPEMQCRGGAVEELHLCFYKDFTPRDCATEPHIESYVVTSRSSCPKYVSLPVQVSSGLTGKHVASHQSI